MAVFKPLGIKSTRLVPGVYDDRKVQVKCHVNMCGDTLYHYFSHFGEVELVKICTNRRGTSRGNAIVLFKNAETVNRVLLRTTYHIGDQQIIVESVKNSVKIEYKPSECKIFVKGVTKDLTDSDLISHFSKFGNVLRVSTPSKLRRRQRYSIVTFTTMFIVEYLLKYHPKHVIKGIEVKIHQFHSKSPEVPYQTLYLPERTVRDHCVLDSTVVKEDDDSKK